MKTTYKLQSFPKQGTFKESPHVSNACNMQCTFNTMVFVAPNLSFHWCTCLDLICQDVGLLERMDEWMDVMVMVPIWSSLHWDAMMRGMYTCYDENWNHEWWGGVDNMDDVWELEMQWLHDWRGERLRAEHVAKWVGLGLRKLEIGAFHTWVPIRLLARRRATDFIWGRMVALILLAVGGRADHLLHLARDESAFISRT